MSDGFKLMIAGLVGLALYLKFKTPVPSSTVSTTAAPATLMPIVPGTGATSETYTGQVGPNASIAPGEPEPHNNIEVFRTPLPMPVFTAVLTGNPPPVVQPAPVAPVQTRFPVYRGVVYGGGPGVIQGRPSLL